MKTSVIGYPRVGTLRELKFATEKYFKGDITKDELSEVSAQLRQTHWQTQSKSGIDYISSNDFSLYDNLLDTAVLLNAVPKRYQQLQLDELDTYFAMARGYQGEHGDVKALAMKKWFNTNYHCMVPEIEDNANITLTGTKPFDEYAEAKVLGIETKPSIIGAFTLLKLCRFTGEKTAADFANDVIRAYSDILIKFESIGAAWVQFDEPLLVTDLAEDDITLFNTIYNGILSAKGKTKVLLQTYFGDVRDGYEAIMQLPFDGVGLDFAEGTQSLDLVKRFGFPKGKTLFVGVVNGKNIWRNHYAKTLSLLSELKQYTNDVVLSTSCSLLHVPYTLKNETKLSADHKKHFAFAEEKLTELAELKKILSTDNPMELPEYIANTQLFSEDRNCDNSDVQSALAVLSDNDFVRLPEFHEREHIQKAALNLPTLPTTTIGSFPQTADVKKNRADYKKGNMTKEQYTAFNQKKIAECVALQEDIGLDVLVHGEFERNDMVEYFGENLDGYVFTEKAWVQSYGTRCVKPPIIWGDVSRTVPITVDTSVYAQSLTKKPMKGMLTGPVTILNWSFPREDISLRQSAYQIALAIRAEVLDLEANGIHIIQIDEAALREKLPLRKSDWHSEYLSWAIPSFRLVHSGVKPETQIHTHMCYSEFSGIIRDIDDMDADVITFEASRSDLTIIEVLNKSGFKTQAGPGVYDIHSPRVPGVLEIKTALNTMVEKLPLEKLWVNPDCGLKTRGDEETEASLRNMVQAAREIREEI